MSPRAHCKFLTLTTNNETDIWLKDFRANIVLTLSRPPGERSERIELYIQMYRYK